MLNFKNPPHEYYPAPFWFWNDMLEDDELERQLILMREQNVFEYYIHARSGLITEYLSEEWFHKIEVVLNKSKELGMRLWIYDEENFPSGYAGGRVMAENPDYTAKHIKLLHVNNPDILDTYEHGVFLAAYSESGELLTEDKNELSAFTSGGRQVYAAIIDYTRWHPAYSDDYYTDVLNYESTQCFLRVTHDEYKKRFGYEFGKTIKGFFTDEPGIYNNLKLLQWSDKNDDDTIAWTGEFREFFKTENGYDIVPMLWHIWHETEQSGRLRRDFYETVCALYTKNFLNPQKDYCERHGMEFVGHLHMEDFLNMQVLTQGNLTKALKGLSYAGTDRIDENFLKINEKMISSFGHQYNKPRVLSETFALTTWGLNFQRMRQILDYQYVRGINYIVQHAFYYSIREERVNECPPSQFFQNPYYKHYHMFSDYAGRLSFLLTRGSHIANAAVYYPIDTAQYELSPSNWEAAETLDLFIQNVAIELLNAQIDFDFINDDAFENVSGDILKINEEQYPFLLFPGCKVLPFEVMSLLLKLAKKNQQIVFIKTVPQICLNANRQDEYTSILNELLSLSNVFVQQDHHLYKPYTYRYREEYLFAMGLDRDISLASADSDIKYLHRKDNECDIYFITNEALGEKTHTITFNCGKTPYIFDALTGQYHSVKFKTVNGKTEVDLHFSHYESLVLVFTDESLPAFPADGCIGCESRVLAGVYNIEIDGQAIKSEPKSFSELGFPQFSGEARYTTSFTTEKCEGSRYLIELSGVHDIAEVMLNGKSCGTVLWHPFTIDVTEHIQNGENLLTVAVTNSLMNELEKTDKLSGLLGPVELVIK